MGRWFKKHILKPKPQSKFFTETFHKPLSISTFIEVSNSHFDSVKVESKKQPSEKCVNYVRYSENSVTHSKRREIPLSHI